MAPFANYYRNAVTAPPHPAEILSIQRLRGFTTLMVLFVHIEDICQHLPGWSYPYSYFATHIGYSAVDCFFVISGFIMCFITFRGGFNPKDWLIRRIVRIYPMYITFTLLAIAIWLYNPAMTMGTGEHTWWTALKSLLIIPQDRLPMILVGWTLELEIVFYTVVFLSACFLSFRGLLKVMGALSLLALLRVLFLRGTPYDFFDYHITSLYMFQFFLGALVYCIWRNRLYCGWRPLFPAAVILLALGVRFTYSAPINMETIPRVFIFGLSYSCLILALVNRERHLRETGKAGRRDWLVVAGDASYSIYLSHPFFLATFGKLFVFLPASPLIHITIPIVALIGCFMLGLSLHVIMEAPIINAGKALAAIKPVKNTKEVMP